MGINRYDLVKRHNVILEKADIENPLSVGNGEIAFTADITGMQTFIDDYKSIPLCTMSQWGFHTTPAQNDKGYYTLEDLNLKYYDAFDRKVGYVTSAENQENVFNWLRSNPHRINLGNIGLNIILDDGTKAELKDIFEIHQVLDLWNGILISDFKVEKVPVHVETFCHPYEDMINFSVESELLKQNKIYIEVKFPYGAANISGSDWDRNDRHDTNVVDYGRDFVELLRTVDEDVYFVKIEYSKGVYLNRIGENHFALKQKEYNGRIEFSCLFSKQKPLKCLHSFSESKRMCKEYWNSFWRGGGAIDFSKCEDKRAFELERRVILSQYLTAIQCSGSMPPQETGLTCNSWYGKFHLEMHWWHAVHFALWGRMPLLSRSIWWYRSIFNVSRDIARKQGYKGVRWPKMVGPDGRDSPSPIGPLLVWQQPHLIYYSELFFRENPTEETLDMFKDIVINTADFIASFVAYDRKNDRYILAPPLIPAQENHDPNVTLNPVFELEYFSFALEIAVKWIERLGLNVNQEWNEIRFKLANLPSKDGVYISHEKCINTYEKFNFDHPSMLAALGMLPGRKVDKETMRRTLHRVLKEWKFEEMWGWDFPMMAMTATRLGEPETAINILLMDSPKNTYMVNGHNNQIPNKELPVYLPGNGGLLAAMALMTAGWDGNSQSTPGFPKNGMWNVEWEGLKAMI
ncbi:MULTISPECIES: hypothetical protein [Thermoanaerobacterium]|uniref:Glycoside hydrolase family 65 n=2 Tax=Thermoanaerobacterium TaxID=28895 RepID=W9ECF1_9THEO|nr:MULTISPECIES: hypothetical protein [Thermoanaerobacterium]AFK85241.1 hypothetical protein Tsac_0205 [Thermoanaerobacterium saccharolyticum JW/SL-YS485]ETO39813.1 hypothetical protein V518_0022 [Thermoanaerobacterium aotearoense SCUT27]